MIRGTTKIQKTCWVIFIFYLIGITYYTIFAESLGRGPSAESEKKVGKVTYRGRILRAEGDKISEIFTFVINNTVEMSWFDSSHRNEENKNIISIDETNLMKLLKGEEYETYKKPVSKFTFRF